MKDRVRRFYSFSRQLADSKRSEFTLLVCGFADASILPLPVTTLLIFLIIINPDKWFRYSSFAISGIVLGAVAGYMAGHFIWIGQDGEFTLLARSLFRNIPGLSEALSQKMQLMYSESGFWILITSGISPLPYCVISILSGALNINFFFFALVTIATQFLKFIFLALLTSRLGEKLLKPFNFRRKPATVLQEYPVDKHH